MHNKSGFTHNLYFQYFNKNFNFYVYGVRYLVYNSSLSSSISLAVKVWSYFRFVVNSQRMFSRSRAY